VEAEDDGKRRRIVLPDGGVVLEQEIERDAGAMALTYGVIEAPLPFRNYRSTIQVAPAGDACAVRWSASFAPLGPEDKVARLVARLYEVGLDGLRRFLDSTGERGETKPGKNEAMIEFERHGQIGLVTLNRPPVNAVNLQWIERFSAILDRLEADRGLAVVRIRSALKVFCGGFDIGLIREHLERGEGAAAQIADTRKLQNVYFRVERLPQVTIAEINGAAMGGGLELALCCDLRLAANDARLGLPEANLGQVPGAGGTQRLTRLCGPGVAARIILACEAVSGREGRELGIVQWAFDGADLEREAKALAERIAALPAETLAASKACIAAQSDRGRMGYEMEVQMNHRLLGTPQTQACVAAFFSRAKR
jgi:enoyl-CoA hydratase/carnithine racemase